MALLHKSQITPSKTALITPWVLAQPWFVGDPTPEVEKVATFRLDDPEGRVGIETVLVAAGSGPVLQVPLTYRDTPLEGGEAWLIGTMEHSVLGTRYVYDAVGDPAYVRATATAALGGGHQAEEYYEADGVKTFRDPTVFVTGSGSREATAIAEPAVGTITTTDVVSTSTALSGDLRLHVSRVPVASPLADSALDASTSAVLDGTWAGQESPVALVVVTQL